MDVFNILLLLYGCTNDTEAHRQLLKRLDALATLILLENGADNLDELHKNQPSEILDTVIKVEEVFSELLKLGTDEKKQELFELVDELLIIVTNYIKENDPDGEFSERLPKLDFDSSFLSAH